jgi:hypothetical protein
VVVFIEEKKCTVPAVISPFTELTSVEILFIRSVKKTEACDLFYHSVLCRTKKLILL